MFWIFASVAAILGFAVSAGQFSVIYALMRIGLFVSFVVIAVLSIALLRRKK